MAKSVEQMLRDMHQAEMEGADVVEIRLDCISNFQAHRDLKLLLENKPLQVVIVYRYAPFSSFQYYERFRVTILAS
ncbi:UNVERIFIED_CONTAM: hypothetical protein Sradi_3781500 [Sesamum radiatum]|uniref:Uncharacterized protein n=1 Tax=Sesamum radiatum TaxID=300843 RepID=A0AAW2PZR8_SESRA